MRTFKLCTYPFIAGMEMTNGALAVKNGESWFLAPMDFIVAALMLCVFVIIYCEKFERKAIAEQVDDS